MRNISIVAASEYTCYTKITLTERERQREEQKEMRRAQNKSFLYADAKNIVKVTY